MTVPELSNEIQSSDGILNMAHIVRSIDTSDEDAQKDPVLNNNESQSNIDPSTTPVKSQSQRNNNTKKKQSKHKKGKNESITTPIEQSRSRNATLASTPLHSPSPMKMCNVIHDSFNTYYQKTKSKGYKVHKPGCRCNKIQKIRSSNTLHDDKLEGFIVIGDGGKASNIYLHRVSLADFTVDWKAKEIELNDVIFPKGVTEEKLGFKVSCASCLLEIEPNGFVCINSKSYHDVEYARNLAQTLKEEKEKLGQLLHHDHAHCMLVLHQSIFRDINLKSLSKSTRIPSSNMPAIKDALAKEGIDTDSIVQIEFGHHLISLILLMGKKNNFFLAIALFEDMDEGKRKITIDLPGGKRHLAETSMECAIREVQEETSLIIDETWNAGDKSPLQKKGGSDRCNVYFDMRPPMESLLNDTTVKLSKATIK
jgi:hypothetical protein